MSDARTDLLRLIHGFEASQAIHVAATLGLADLLHHGPANAIDLAQKASAHQGSLHRLLQVLASIGIVEPNRDGRFALTQIGEFLRSDVSGTFAAMAELIGRPNFWQAWGDLLYAVKTGNTAFDHVHGSDVWDYRSRQPEEARIFDQAMGSGTEKVADAVLDIYDFGKFEQVVDVGGGDGIFLAKILARHPHVRGTLFDRPHVIARTCGSGSLKQLDGRCQAVGGNFFSRVPEDGDVYLLKWILHDWSDTASVDILSSCRRAMKPSAKLLIVEHVLGPDMLPEGTFMDLMMMVMNGGRERTYDEFFALFSAAGFRLTSVTPTSTPLSLIEGVIAGA